jgi:spermidine synthase
MGAGGSIRMTRLTAPDIEIDAVEIDPLVVEAADRFFGLRAEPNRLRIHVADARPWLARSRASYDLIHVDLYHGGPYVPFYLVTEEFFRLVRARLAPDGLLMMNVYDLGAEREILSATVATLRRVYPSVLVLSRADQNHILFAFPQARSLDSIRAQLQEAAQGQGGIADLARRAATSLQEFIPAAGTPVFTDDHAPIEEFTRRMLSKQ